MTISSFGLSAVGQISVNAHDLARAEAFYRDVLGVQHLFTVPKMAFFECGGLRLMVALPERPEFDHPSSVIYFRVDDIGKAHDALVGRGIRFEAPPHLIARLDAREIWMAFFHDSEGNLLALMSEIDI